MRDIEELEQLSFEDMTYEEAMAFVRLALGA